MAYSFEVTTSLGRVRSYCVQVVAGLEATGGLDDKIGEWSALKQNVAERRTSSEAATDLLTHTQTVNRVKDTSWDTSYTEGSGIAYLLAGKKKKNEPYATVMRVPASRATKFGHAKATVVGDRVLKEVTRIKKPTLTAWADAFAPANDALKASGKAMEAAEDALDDPRFEKRALVRQLNTLIATTEAAILTVYPGRGSLADAILVPSWARRDTAKNGADGASDEGDDVVVDVDGDDAEDPSDT